MNYRFSLGIDLGTSNSAIAISDIDSERTEIIELTQVVGPQSHGREADSAFRRFTSPIPRSFPQAPFPCRGEQASGASRSSAISRASMARWFQTALITSAKSWLSNPHIDPRQHVLPWKSEIREAKLSAFDCSRMLP